MISSKERAEAIWNEPLSAHWSDHWGTITNNADDKWHTATNSAPASAFSYSPPKKKASDNLIVDYWDMGKNGKLQMFERELKGDFIEEKEKDHLSELEELFEI